VNTLGIVGGIAPESTIDYYRRILAAYRLRRTDDSNPHIIINSIDVARVLSLAGSRQLAELTDYMADAVSALIDAGASIGLFASNTPHLVFDAVQERSSIPLISIVEATRDYAQARGVHRVGLVGTRSTMQTAFYPKVFASSGIKVISPNAQEQEIVHDRYVGELVEGVFRPETRAQMLSIIDGFTQREQLDAVVLAGTELPLLLRTESVAGVALLDTTEIHVQAAVEWMFG
jgi:aspartate racemase